MVIVDATAVHLDYLDSVNKADLDRIRGMFHPEYTYTGADGVEKRGPEAGVAQVQGFVTAFPGLTLTANHRHVCGDVSIIEATARGTHTAALAIKHTPTRRIFKSRMVCSSRVLKLTSRKPVCISTKLHKTVRRN